MNSGITTIKNQATEVGQESSFLKKIDDLSDWSASASFVNRIPISFARRHGVLGLVDEGPIMPVAIRDISSLDAMDNIGRLLGCHVHPYLCNHDDLISAINQGYQEQSGQAEVFIEKLDRQEIIDDLETVDSSNGREDLLDGDGRAPVIRLVNLLLFEAVQQQASDIHIQPHEERIMARLRIDGVLFDIFELRKAMLDEVVSRIKVMGKMNIAEKRLPQDGRATVQVGDRIVDLRISVVPTSFGEQAVIRLLDKSARLYQLEDLGMDSYSLDRFESLIGVEHGLVLVTGPTGSGKSTTLYAALQRIDTRQRHVITIEDPIEYQLPGVSQIQISDRKGMTFASGLRSVLRQDPDVIMVGEIRDHETAVMAIQSALTGHLVFSTLHTNDAASAVTRLLDLGIEPYLVASSLMGVLAQRLVRVVCPYCMGNRATDTHDFASMDNLHHEFPPTNPDNSQSVSTILANHCEHCRSTGYRGRVGVFEMLTIDESTGSLIQERATAAAIKKQAINSGMRTLRDSGLEKVNEGKTTMDEVMRVTMRAAV